MKYGYLLVSCMSKKERGVSFFFLFWNVGDTLLSFIVNLTLSTSWVALAKSWKPRQIKFCRQTNGIRKWFCHSNVKVNEWESKCIVWIFSLATTFKEIGKKKDSQSISIILIDIRRKLISCGPKNRIACCCNQQKWGPFLILLNTKSVNRSLCFVALIFELLIYQVGFCKSYVIT